jgi:hypothetical protein
MPLPSAFRFDAMPTEVLTHQIVNLQSSIGLAAAALALTGCTSMSPGAAPGGDSGFDFALWSPQGAPKTRSSNPAMPDHPA